MCSDVDSRSNISLISVIFLFVLFSSARHVRFLVLVI